LECSLSQKQAFSKKKKVFAGFGVSLFTKNKRSLKKNKKIKKKVFAGIDAFFFVPKMAQDTSLRGAKVAQGGPKISPEGAAAPLLPAPMTLPQWRGNYFRTGRQDQRRQSLEREVGFFAEIGLFCPKYMRSIGVSF